MSKQVMFLAGCVGPLVLWVLATSAMNAESSKVSDSKIQAAVQKTLWAVEHPGNFLSQLIRVIFAP
jgi:hypothetical protein